MAPAPPMTAAASTCSSSGSGSPNVPSRDSQPSTRASSNADLIILTSRCARAAAPTGSASPRCTSFRASWNSNSSRIMSDHSGRYSPSIASDNRKSRCRLGHRTHVSSTTANMPEIVSALGLSTFGDRPPSLPQLLVDQLRIILGVDVDLRRRQDTVLTLTASGAILQHVIEPEPMPSSDALGGQFTLLDESFHRRTTHPEHVRSLLRSQRHTSWRHGHSPPGQQRGHDLLQCVVHFLRKLDPIMLVDTHQRIARPGLSAPASFVRVQEAENGGEFLAVLDRQEGPLFQHRHGHVTPPWPQHSSIRTFRMRFRSVRIVSHLYADLCKQVRASNASATDTRPLHEGAIHPAK